MKITSPILIASDGAGDLEMIKSLLQPEFETVTGVTGASPSVAAFERISPAVLILAFDALERCGLYYRELVRCSALIWRMPHKTIVLCTKDELREAYRRCRDREFDDYVLFWPMAQDAQRLLMAVHHALRRLEAEAAVAPAPATSAAPVDPAAVQAGRPGLQTAAPDPADRADMPWSTRGPPAGPGMYSPATGQPENPGARPPATPADAPGLSAPPAAAAARNMRPPSDGFPARHDFRPHDTTGPASPWLNEGDLRELVAPRGFDDFPDPFAPRGHAGAHHARTDAPRARIWPGVPIRPLLLMVDDDAQQHRILRQLVQRENMDITFASTGADALESMGSRQPDLILMAVELPDGNGIAFTRHIKSLARFALIPVVMTTGRADKGLIVRCVAAGAAGFVVKPFKKDVVLGKIFDCLGRKPGSGSA